MIRNRRSAMLLMLAGIGLLGCSADVSLFNQSFVNLFTGSVVPIVPGPDPGYVMVMGMNDSEESIEFVVTAESEELIVTVNNLGQVTSFEATVLEPETVNLITDPTATSLGIVFDNTEVTWPTKGPLELDFQDVQGLINQLVAKDPEALTDRDFIRLVRVLRVGLGPDLNLPSGEDDGIIVRPAGSDQSSTAGLVFPSGVNNALSYDVGNDPADFGNGDMIIFLATSNASAVGGISVSAGVIDGDEASVNSAQYVRDTFEILRREEGPINPPPPS